MSNIDLSQIITAEDKAATEQEARRAGVNAERDRRINAGATISVTGYGDIPVQGRPGDQINLIALGDTAKELAAAGQTGAVIPFRDTNNVVHDLTPDQVIEMVATAKQHVSAIYAASWALKDAESVPIDYDNDQHWP